MTIFLPVLAMLFVQQDPSPEPMSRYLSDLEKAGVLTEDKAPATVERIRATLVDAESDLVTGNAEMATARLFRIVESVRFEKLAYSPEYANAELTLGRALVRAGAYASAERYLLRALAHGPKSPFFAPAYRAMVDIALETREQTALLAMLDKAEADLKGAQLPRDSNAEHEYLAGKVAYEANDLPGADAHFANVDRQSRFFAAALYFRGLAHARKGHYAAARASLCEIVEQADQDRFTFFIDGRYYAIKDLAYLALGRISHEQAKYDDSYYFYFRVPEDSDRLPDALFEASWSMFQKQEYEAAGAFLDQFDRSFPKSPLAPDVLLLHAMIDLKSCQFDRVRAELEELVRVYKPIEAEVSALLKDPGRRRVLYKRLLSKQQIGAASDPVVELLKIDGKFYRYFADIVALDREAGLLPAQVAVWDELTAKQTGERKGQRRQRGGPAGQGRRGAAAAREGRSRDGGSRGRSADGGATRGAPREPPRPVRRGGDAHAGAFGRGTRAADSARRRDERDRRAGAAGPRHAPARDAAAGAPHADRRRHRQEEEARDRDLEPARGRYPPDMFAQLQLEGLMGDDEEYWPFEGEYWSDEYENYK